VRYWWVNQNQTHRQEQAGGYLWSPKRNANGAKNPFYESMREVSPGDVVFAFVDTVIAAIGVAQSYCWESPKPIEFGTTGEYWEGVGGKSASGSHHSFTECGRKITWGCCGPFCPRSTQRSRRMATAIQGIYLTELAPPLAETLAGLRGAEAQALIGSVSVGALMQTNDDLDYWEHKIEAEIERNTVLPPTDRIDIIRARRGQGLFKQRVMQIEQRCRITGVTNPVHLIASHCKPWRDSDKAERLNGENGLLLTPSIDHLFDRGFIGFEDSGKLIVSPVAHRPSLKRDGHRHQRNR